MSVARRSPVWLERLLAEQDLPQVARGVLRAAALGEWADFSDARDPVTGAPGTVLEALWLRRLMCLRWPPDAAAAHLDGGPYALRLRGVRIQGVLDLRDAKGPDGQGCHPLILEDCWLVGDLEGERPQVAPDHRPDPAGETLYAAIDARHARLARLVLRRCRFHMIDLSDARLSADLELEDVEALTEEGQCWVQAKGMHVSGNARFRNTKLRCRQPAPRAPEQPNEYALNLPGAVVEGDLSLRPGFVADGGVGLSGARIRGDIWGDGAYLDGRGNDAFSAQMTQVEGGVVLRCLERDGQEQPDRFVAIGRLNFLGARIDGPLDLRGTDLRKPDGTETAMVLGLGLATLGGNLSCNPWPRGAGQPAIPFRADGLVQLWHATVRSQAIVVGEIQELQVLHSSFASELTLGGVRGPVQLSGTRIEGRLEVEGGGGSLLGAGLEVAGEVVLSGRFGSPIELPGARLDKNLWVDGPQTALNGQTMKVGGDLGLSGPFRDHIDLQGSRIEGNLHLALQLSRPRSLSSPSVPGLGVVPDIHLEDVTVVKDLQVQQVGFDDPPEWTEARLERLRTRSLSFYPGWKLAECQTVAQATARTTAPQAPPTAEETPAEKTSAGPGEPAESPQPAEETSAETTPTVHLVSFLYRPRTRWSRRPWELVLLGGESAPIHRLNADKLLRLRTRRRREDYLRFFCSHIWGEEGAFQILESPDQIPVELEAKTREHIRPIRLGKREKDGSWITETVILYSTFLFRATMKLYPTGMVEMLSDEPLQELTDPPRAVRYPRPVRVLRPEATTGTAEWPWDSPMPSNSRTVAEPEGRDLYQRFRRSLWTGWVSLHRGHARALHDNWGIWGDRVRVRLDAFQTDWFDSSWSPPPAFFSQPNPPFSTSWEARVRWIETQCEQARVRRDPTIYSPQPFEDLARILRAEGDDETARQVTLRKLRLERRLIDKPLWKAPWKAILTLFDWTSAYALSPVRSTATFLIFLALGVWGVGLLGSGKIWPLPVRVYDAAAHPGLVVKTAPVSLVGGPDEAGTAVRSVPGPLLRPRGVELELPCGDRIDPVLYPLDVFIPLVDLGQEGLCSVSARPGAWPWRWLMTGYRLLGWVVTPLLLLTFTKRLLRHVER